MSTGEIDGWKVFDFNGISMDDTENGDIAVGLHLETLLSRLHRWVSSLDVEQLDHRGLFLLRSMGHRRHHTLINDIFIKSFSSAGAISPYCSFVTSYLIGLPWTLGSQNSRTVSNMEVVGINTLIPSYLCGLSWTEASVAKAGGMK